VIYLTAAQILFIHSRLIDETGGSHGIRDLGLLESAAARPLATFEGNELNTDVFDKAAALMDSLIRNHPFIDGNKRTAISAAALFLQLNGRRLIAGNTQLESFTMLVVESKPGIAESAAWFGQHSERIK
jgi:death-on-curing protein